VKSSEEVVEGETTLKRTHQFRTVGDNEIAEEGTVEVGSTRTPISGGSNEEWLKTLITMISLITVATVVAFSWLR
jgi:hypothetical protein